MSVLTWFDGLFKGHHVSKTDTKKTDEKAVDYTDKEFSDEFNQCTLDAVKEMDKGIKPKLVKIA